MKIEIKSIYGNVLFEYDCERNTKAKTLLKAIKEGANLRRTNLRRANLEGVSLRDANLEGAYLRRAYLRRANLYGANLEGANLEGANLEGVNLYGANLEGANLEGVARTEKIHVLIAKYNGLIAAIEGDKANYLHKVKKAKALVSVALCRQFVNDLNQLIQEDEKD